MTRFVGEAVGQRSGRGGGGNTSKDRAKKMQQFLDSGVHADVETAKRLREGKLPELPEFDPNHSFVFMDLAIANKPAGRLVIELFDELVPVGTAHLRNRCLPGSRIGLAGSSVHKLVPHYAAFLGRSSSASESMTLRPVNALRALQAGTVSVSMTGDEVAISLARALTLDTTGYQVVGRVHLGKEVLDLLNDQVAGPDSAPFLRISVTKSGSTNARGDHESVEQDGPVTKEDAIARLKEESASARSAVLEALQVGLGSSAGPSKRKAAGEKPEEEAGPSSAAEGEPPVSKAQKTAAGAQKAAGAQAPRSGAAAEGSSKSRSKMLDAMLGDDSGSGSDEEA